MCLYVSLHHRAVFCCQKALDTTLGEFHSDGLYLNVLPIATDNSLAAVDDALSRQRTNFVVRRVAAVRLVEIDTDGDILEVFPHSGQ